MDQTELNQSLLETNVVKENNNATQTTRWRQIIVAALITLLSSLESTIIMNMQWPYLMELDPSLTPTFMGSINSSSKALHAIFAIAFGVVAVKSRKIRPSLYSGRFFSIAASILFIKAEYFGKYSAYILFMAYVLYGIADSSLMLLRGLMATESSQTHRAIAFSLLALSNVFSMICAGGSLIGFSHLSYPGIRIGGLHLHIYTFPIVLIIGLNILTILLITFGLEETANVQKDEEKKSSISLLHPSSICKFISSNRLSVSLILLCFLEKMVVSTSLTTTLTISSPLSMAVFGWSGSTQVRIQSIANTAIGVLALFTVAGFMLGKIGVRFASWKILLVCISVIFTYYFTLLPHRLISFPVELKTPSHPFGCDPNQYSWCAGSYRPSPHLFYILIVVVFGVFYPIANISLDTTYSKILGDIDQSFLQSAIIAADDVVQIIAPILITSTFHHFGYSLVFLFQGIFVAIGLVLWVCNAKRLSEKSQ